MYIAQLLSPCSWTVLRRCRTSEHNHSQEYLQTRQAWRSAEVLFLWEGMVNFEGRYDVEKARVWDFEANAAPAFLTGVCGCLAMPSSEHPRQY